MNPKFTPGPWIALKGAGWLVTRPDATARREAAIAVGMTPAASLVESPWFDETEAQANATLIAAAPDLYAALEEAEAFVAAWACHHATQGATTIDDYAKATSPEGWHPTHRKIYENVRAALAKAGKQ